MAALRLLCAGLRWKFPRVPVMSSDQLVELMKAENPQRNLVLLDVREKTEFQVSQLPGAIHVHPEMENMKAILENVNAKAGGTEQPKTIVAYCAVGYRASLMVQRLSQHLKEFSSEDTPKVDLFNLEGSIFKWANEGKELVQPCTGKRTTVVHPFDNFWGNMFLDASVRSFEPEK